MSNNLKSKCLKVAICGLANAGKSTLINQILDYKLAITSYKPQTTRTTIKGIYTEGEYQIVFYDTPGIFLKEKNHLDYYLKKQAWGSIIETDYVLLMIDCTKPYNDIYPIIEIMKENDLKVSIVINKIDKILKDKLLSMIVDLNSRMSFDHIFMISALKNRHISDVLDYLKSISYPSEFIYDPEYLTDAPVKYLASEITREAIYLKLQQEIPYQVTVVNERWEETETEILITQVIYVTHSRYKKIILGNKGSMVSSIISIARNKIQEILPDQKIDLFVFVKEKLNWTEDKMVDYVDIGVSYEGYDFDEDLNNESNDIYESILTLESEHDYNEELEESDIDINKD